MRTLHNSTTDFYLRIRYRRKFGGTVAYRYIFTRLIHMWFNGHYNKFMKKINKENNILPSTKP